MNKNNDEIDLIEIFSRIANWFKKLFNNIILFFIRNASLLLIFILIGVGLAVINYFISEKYYNTEIILQTNAVSSSDMINYLNKGNVKEIAGINSLYVKEIKSFYIIDINNDGQADYVDYENVRDTSITNRRMRNKFSIQVSVYENAPIYNIKKSIITYINKNEYFQDVNNLRIKQLNNLIAKTDIELQKLDSLESINYFKSNPYLKETGKNMILLNEKKIKLFHEDILSLYKDKQAYEKEITLYKNTVTVIHDFQPATQVENSITKKTKDFVIISFFIGLVCSIFIDQRKSLKVLIKSAKKE
ncbi:MAG: hypothetical protein IMY72_06695 [Bacteroidetes bacterium]|nr:hypothetical protein [Bacteroidota bacterium]